ncbi:MAG: hypothetical protein ACRDXX_08935 [Stackebrandtia sp.]
MSWTWQFEDAEGNPFSASQTEHNSQGDAESWLGETWKELADSGAAVAILVDEDRVEYRMSLAPPE